jgi:hypothetical protein
MGDYFHEAIYIKSNDRETVINAIRTDVWSRLLQPETVTRTRGYLHLSQPLNGWMQLYYRRPFVHVSAVNSADKVLDYAWRAFTFPEPCTRVFEDEEGSFSFHFEIGGLEFANIDKSVMRKAQTLNQLNDIGEEWHNHPFSQKVVKMLDKYLVMEKAILANQSKISLVNWNYKKYGTPPREIVNIDRHVFLKGFEEWEIADFETARFENAKKLYPKERNRKSLEHFGREAERIMQVPFYWEAEEDIEKTKYL